MNKRLIVLDTNCLLQMLGIRSKYRFLWDDFMSYRYTLCVSNDILHEYEEILSQKASPFVADMFLRVLLRSKNVILKDPYFYFNLIEQDVDDNKFVDCAILCGADFIVSNDTHFKCLNSIPFPSVRVISLDEFAEEMKHVEYNVDDSKPTLLNEPVTGYQTTNIK